MGKFFIGVMEDKLLVDVEYLVDFLDCVCFVFFCGFYGYDVCVF